MQKFWLQEDKRDRSYEFATVINDAMLEESYAAQENQLEMKVDIGNFISVADRPKYIGNEYYEGRVISFPSAERCMPEMFSAGVEISECRVTISNVDSVYTKYLPGGSEYTTFFGQYVDVSIGLRDVGNSLKKIFSGVVSHEGGVNLTKDQITFKFRDRLDKLNEKYPLESITIEAFPEAPNSSIGQIIPLVLGDFEANWEWKENGNASFQATEDASINAINMTPIGSGGGVPSYHVGGNLFIFCTGGRLGKTYYPGKIQDVIIKRGSNFFWGIALYSGPDGSDPIAVGGHWACQIALIKARSVTGEILTYSYYYQDGDIAILKVKVPIGAEWDEDRDTNPLEQAKESLIAMGRITPADIDPISFEKVKSYFSSSISGAITHRIKLIGDYSVGNLSALIGKYFTFGVFNDTGLEIFVYVIFLESWNFVPTIEELLGPSYAGLPVVYVSLDSIAFYGEFSNPQRPANAGEMANWIATCFLTGASNFPIPTDQLFTSQVTVINDQEAYLDILPKYEMSTAPNMQTTPFQYEAKDNRVTSGGIKTRCWFGDKNKEVLSSVSSLLKCCLVDIFINQNLQIAFTSLWPKHFPQLDECIRINQYDIMEDSIQLSNEPRDFFTCAQANWSWVYWLNTAGASTKKLKNLNAEYKANRSVVKEIDLPNIYSEETAIDVLKNYIRLASACLVKIEMEVGWRHLLRDLGEFVLVNIRLGNLNFTDVPCQIRKISILPTVCGSKLELVSFINFSYPAYISPSAGRNLSSDSQELVDA